MVNAPANIGTRNTMTSANSRMVFPPCFERRVCFLFEMVSIFKTLAYGEGGVPEPTANAPNTSIEFAPRVTLFPAVKPGKGISQFQG